jgi:hypothetical protein
MEKTLGIYVTTDDQIDRLIKLCRASKRKGVKVKLFLTHIGTRLSQDPRFQELAGLAEIVLCKVGFEANKLEKPVQGLEEKAFGSQSQHAEMLHDCDRYMSF